MKSPNTKITATKRRTPPLPALVIGLIILVGLVWGGVTLFNTLNKSTANYAEEEAKPLEDALVKAGGVKVCSRGDAGRGSDNDRPNYESHFQLAMNKGDAAKLVNRVAEDGGFVLSHSDSPYESIEWYTDKTSKESSYRELDAGKVMLNISTYNDTSKQVSGCLDGTQLVGDDTHTAVTLSVGLPSIKR